MLASERINEIESMIFKEGKVLVKDLVKKYKVSPDLIRKDLKKLSTSSAILRVRGGAILKNERALSLSFEKRNHTNVPQKKEIAELAVKVINQFDTIFIDNSSIGFFIAEKIIEYINFPITVVTNVFETANILKSKQNINLIFIGGAYNNYLGCCNDYSSHLQIKKFVFDISFIGTTSIDFNNHSLSTYDIEEGNIKSTIISQSKKTYVVMSSHHFKHNGRFLFSNLDNIETIITDSNIKQEYIKLIEQSNTNLITNALNEKI